jgi:hypothetical protein
MVDLRDEEARRIIRLILENQTIPMDRFTEVERRIIDELIREGYLRECVSPGPRITEAMEEVADEVRITTRPPCLIQGLATAGSIAALLSYIAGRAFSAGYPNVALFFTALAMVSAPLTYWLTGRICTRLRRRIALHL